MYTRRPCSVSGFVRCASRMDMARAAVGRVRMQDARMLFLGCWALGDDDVEEENDEGAEV